MSIWEGIRLLGQVCTADQRRSLLTRSLKYPRSFAFICGSKPGLELCRVFRRDQLVFRPCIDLHEGKVKQIVGGTLGDDPSRLRTNFVSERPASWFAELYKRDGLRGGHIIMLG